MENFYNNLDDLINYIKNTIEYKKCLELKNKMSSNTNINKLMNDIRDLQKKYIILQTRRGDKNDLYVTCRRL